MRKKILFLTLNTFHTTGGIQEVCRSFSKVLKDTGSRFKMYAMQDRAHDERYIAAKNFKGFKSNRINFTYQALATGISTDIIVLSHIHLLLLARIIKFLRPGKRIIMYAHGIEVWRPISSWKKRFLQRDVEIWAVSRFTADKMISLYQIPANKITVVNNCLNPHQYFPSDFNKPTDLLSDYDLKPKQPVLFTLTRISSSERYKGYDKVINILPELVKLYPNLLYIISGKADGAERDRVVSLVKAHGVERNVLMTGYLTQEELGTHFLLADCFVLPSKKEGFGIVLIEAAAHGCRIVAGNADGSTDALLDGALGDLIDPDSTDEIFNAIKAILGKPRSAELSYTIQQRCNENFGFLKYKEKVHALLSEAS